MRYPKIGLELNLGEGEDRGDGVLWLGVIGGGKGSWCSSFSYASW